MPTLAERGWTYEEYERAASELLGLGFDPSLDEAAKELERQRREQLVQSGTRGDLEDHLARQRAIAGPAAPPPPEEPVDVEQVFKPRKTEDDVHDEMLKARTRALEFRPPEDAADVALATEAMRPRDPAGERVLQKTLATGEKGGVAEVLDSLRRQSLGAGVTEEQVDKVIADAPISGVSEWISKTAIPKLAAMGRSSLQAEGMPAAALQTTEEDVAEAFAAPKAQESLRKAEKKAVAALVDAATVTKEEREEYEKWYEEAGLDPESAFPDIDFDDPQIYESNFGWTLRTLQHGLSGLGWLGHDLPKWLRGQGEDPLKSLAKRFREGRGLAGSMEDTFVFFDEAYYGKRDDSKEVPWHKDPAWLGWLTGFFAELFIPVDFGALSGAVKTAKGVKEVAETARAVDVPFVDVAKKQWEQRKLNPVQQTVVELYADSPVNQENMTALLKVRSQQLDGDRAARFADGPKAEWRASLEGTPREGTPEEIASFVDGLAKQKHKSDDLEVAQFYDNNKAAIEAALEEYVAPPKTDIEVTLRRVAKDDEKIAALVEDAGGSAELVEQWGLAGFPVSESREAFRQTYLRPAYQRVSQMEDLGKFERSIGRHMAGLSSDEFLTATSRRVAAAGPDGREALKGMGDLVRKLDLDDLNRVLVDPRVRTPLAKALLQQAGAKRIRGAIQAGKARVPGGLEMATTDLWIDGRLARQIKQDVEMGGIGEVGDALVGLMDGPVKLTPDQLKVLAHEMIGRFSGNPGLDSIADAKITLGPDVVDILRNGVVQNTRQWHKLVMKAIEMRIRMQPTAITAAQKAEIVQGARGRTALVVPLSRSLQEKFELPELRGNELDIAIRHIFHTAQQDPLKLLSAQALSSVGELGTKMLQDVGERIAALQRSLRYDIVRKRAHLRKKHGRSRKQAMNEAAFAVVVDDYRKAPGYVEVTDGKIRQLGTGEEPIDVRRSGAHQLYEDYFSGLFGGQENKGIVLQDSAGTVKIDSQKLAPDEARGVVGVLSHVEDTLLKVGKDEFTRLVLAEDYTGAINLLRLLHRRIQGKRLSELFPSRLWQSQLKLLEDTVDRPLVKYGMTIEDLTKAYEKGADQSVMFHHEDFAPYFMNQAAERRKGNIVREVMHEAGTRYPELFPSAENLAMWGTQEASLLLRQMQDLFEERARRAPYPDDPKRIDPIPLEEPPPPEEFSAFTRYAPEGVLPPPSSATAARRRAENQERFEAAGLSEEAWQARLQSAESFVDEPESSFLPTDPKKRREAVELIQELMERIGVVQRAGSSLVTELALLTPQKAKPLASIRAGSDILGETAVAALRELDTAADAASWLAKNATNPAHQAIAKRIAPHISSDVRFVVVDNAPQTGAARRAMDTESGRKVLTGSHKLFRESPKTLAVYQPASEAGHYVAIRGSDWGADGLTGESVVHELLHAATHKRLRDQDAAAQEARGQLRQVLGHLRVNLLERDPSAQHPWTKFVQSAILDEGDDALDELITYAFTDARFQEHLRSIQIPGEDISLGSKFLDIIRRLFGIDPSDATALDQVIRATDRLLDATGDTATRSPKSLVAKKPAGGIADIVDKYSLQVAKTFNRDVVFDIAGAGKRVRQELDSLGQPKAKRAVLEDWARTIIEYRKERWGYRAADKAAVKRFVELAFPSYVEELIAGRPLASGNSLGASPEEVSPILTRIAHQVGGVEAGQWWRLNTRLSLDTKHYRNSFDFEKVIENAEAWDRIAPILKEWEEVSGYSRETERRLQAQSAEAWDAVWEWRKRGVGQSQDMQPASDAHPEYRALVSAAEKAESAKKDYEYKFRPAVALPQIRKMTRGRMSLPDSDLGRVSLVDSGPGRVSLTGAAASESKPLFATKPPKRTSRRKQDVKAITDRLDKIAPGWQLLGEFQAFGGFEVRTFFGQMPTPDARSVPGARKPSQIPMVLRRDPDRPEVDLPPEPTEWRRTPVSREDGDLIGPLTEQVARRVGEGRVSAAPRDVEPSKFEAKPHEWWSHQSNPFADPRLVKAFQERGPEIVRNAAGEATQEVIDRGGLGVARVRHVRDVFFRTDDKAKPRAWLQEILDEYPEEIQTRILEAISTSMKGWSLADDANSLTPSAERYLQRVRKFARPDMTANFWFQLRDVYTRAYYDQKRIASGQVIPMAGPAAESRKILLASEDTGAAKVRIKDMLSVEAATEEFVNLYKLRPPGPRAANHQAAELVMPKGATTEDLIRVINEIEHDDHPVTQAVLNGLWSVLDQAIPTRVPIQPRYQDMPTLFGRPGAVAAEAGRRLQRVGKGGVLGGLGIVAPYIGIPIPYAPGWGVLFNMAYFTLNTVTAPAIIQGQLGIGRAAGAARNMLNLDALRVVKELYRPAGVSSPNYVVHKRRGITWTRDDIAKLVSERNVMQSQAQAEIGAALLTDLIKWSGMSRRGTPVSRLRDYMRRNFDFVDSFNWAAEISNAMDIAWRTSVLIDSLKKGEPVDTAVKLARESLFDYGRLSRLEKTWIFKAIWFWTFQRESMRSMLRMLINNPTRAMRQFKLAEGVPNEDNYYDTKNWTAGRIPLGTLADKTTRAYLPGVPQVQSFMLMVDYLGTLSPLIDDAYIGSEKWRGVLNNAIGAYAGQVAPHLKVLPEFYFEKELKFGQKQDLDTWVDSRYFAAIKEGGWTPTLEEFGVYLKPLGTGMPGTTTANGVTWGIDRKDTRSQRNWLVIRRLALTAGLERTARDAMILRFDDDRVSRLHGFEGGRLVRDVTGPELQSPDIEGIHPLLVEFAAASGLIKFVPRATEPIESGEKATESRYWDFRNYARD